MCLANQINSRCASGGYCNGEARPMGPDTTCWMPAVPAGGPTTILLIAIGGLLILMVILEARAHTAQVTSDDRREVKIDSRTADLPSCFAHLRWSRCLILRN